jgi:predicted ArsR family transcriptional regulator
MATEAPEKPVKTKDRVAALLKEGHSAKEISEALGKTLATVYVHIRNIEKEQGNTTPRKRGRPPKVQADGESKPASRPRPPRATRTVAQRGETQKVLDKAASGNGHNAHGFDRFPRIKEAIHEELRAKRNEVAVLEKMLETV